MEKRKLSRGDKLLAAGIEKRIEKAFYEVGKGCKFNIMDLPRIYAKGREIIARNADDPTLRQQLQAFMQEIAV